MEDAFILALSVHILMLLAVDVLNVHMFGIEGVIAIINTALTIYFYYRNRK